MKTDSNIPKIDTIPNNVVTIVDDFYSEYVFGKEELNKTNAKNYLSTKLINYLQKEYQNEYIGDGLAVWKFRTGYQDGIGISSVEIISFETNSKIAIIEILDMGHPATGQIFFMKEGNKLLMDSINIKNR